MKSLILSTLTIIIIFTGTALSQEANQALYQEELRLTLELIAKAEEVNSLWRDTRKLTEEAKEYASQHDYQTAISLLQEAQFQAEAGYNQAINQNKLDELIPYYLK